jgi:hypothetical protein
MFDYSQLRDRDPIRSQRRNRRAPALDDRSWSASIRRTSLIDVMSNVGLGEVGTAAQGRIFPNDSGPER